MKNKTATILRTITLVVLGLTSAWTLLSGVGTVCVAFNAENFESMAAIVPYKPLYQVFVVLTSAVGIAAIAATAALARGKKWSWPGAIIILAVGILVGGTHMYFSNMLRGSSAPANLRVYMSILSILLLLLLRIPSIWKTMNFNSSSDQPGSGAASGLALIAGGVAALVAPLWATPTHIFDGNNWAHFFDIPLIIIGAVLVFAGTAVLLIPRLRQHNRGFELAGQISK